MIIEKEPAEVVEADEFRLPDSTPIGHRVIDRWKPRTQNDGNVDQKNRKHEKPGHDFPAEEKGLPESHLRVADLIAQRRIGSFL